jgi:nitroreductase
MDFDRLARCRRSIRKYLDRPVEREKLLACLEAARLAPSACNSQPWHFIVVDEPELRAAVAAKATGTLVSINRFVPQAPVIVAVVSERSNAAAHLGGLVKGKPYNLMDVGIAAEHFCLQARDLGLGTCMLGWFDERAVKRLLRVPRGKRVELLITLGYTPELPEGPGARKDVGQVVSWNAFGQTE